MGAAGRAHGARVVLGVILLLATIACVRPPDVDGDGVTAAVASPASEASAPEVAEPTPAPSTATPRPPDTATPIPPPTLISPPGASPVGTGVAASSPPTSAASGTPSVPNGNPSPSPLGPSASDGAAPATPAAERVRVAVGAQGANLRREPGTRGAVLGTLRNGVELVVVGPDRTVEGQLWRHVRAPDGGEGWIVDLAVETVATPVPTPAGSSIAATPETSGATPSGTSVPTSAEAGPTATRVPTMPATTTAAPVLARVTDSQGANLRAEPGAGGRLVKPLREGTELTVVGPDRDVAGQLWRNVRDAAGDEGWVVGEAVASLSPTAIAPGEGEAESITTPEDPAAPCQAGQIKGDAASGLYYLPDHPEYAAVRERVRCFDAEGRASASGFLPAP